MVNLVFQNREGVLFAPLSFLGYEGEAEDARNVELVIQEYLIVCGDISTDTRSRDEKLERLRAKMIAAGHTIEIR